MGFKFENLKPIIHQKDQPKKKNHRGLDLDVKDINIFKFETHNSSKGST